MAERGQAARRPIVGANWKMHTTPSEGAALARALAAAELPHDRVDVVLCPPALGVAAVSEAVAGGPIGVGVQNVHWQDAGAFTGEISPAMLSGIASHALVGHSERRALFGETDEMVNRKVRAVLAHGLTPIVCVGESLEQRDATLTQSVVSRQISRALEGLRPGQAATVVVAYEPVWAIGTGRSATPAHAAEAIQWIRAQVECQFGPEAAHAVRIQYGGSVNRANCAALLDHPEIDGALVGGASLDAAEFAAVVRAAVR